MTEISEEQFRADAVTFLEANCSRRKVETKKVWGEGSDNVSVFEEKSKEAELRDVQRAKDFRRKMFDAGFGWIGGPIAYGGRGLSSRFEQIWSEAQRDFVTPNMGVFQIGLGMVAPTFLAHGSDLAKEKYLRNMWRGDIVGCQLFSEPAAGSDLASLQTKAERDGDEWIITGQKVWTTGAQFSDVGEVICRTDPNLPKHKGLTGFIVDMHAPGVEIRPLRQMTGGASFNEVFFNEVRVPDDHRLGDVNHGWTVALTTLMNERAAIGAGDRGGGGSSPMSFGHLSDLMRAMGNLHDPVLRQELVKIHINSQVAKFTGMRAMAKIKAGQLPGPEMSIGKLALAMNMTATSAFVSRVLGMKLTADSGEWGTYSWADFVLGTPGMRIAGGSDEVMRNIVGERVLGLPKEPGIDSVTPFNQLKVGTQKSVAS
jgi:alkylation response protein AidB-like acyl-CoA dehydrogenase